MKRTLFLFCLAVGIVVLGPVYGAQNSLVINEIGAYEPTGWEWVEIVNAGGEAVDLTGFIWWEGETNHSLTLKQGSPVLAPGDFALFVQDDKKFLQKYPTVTSTLFDSSWGSLNEGGEEIGLKDDGGNFIEKFVYITAPDFSLERVDVQKNNYTAENWKQHENGNTVGAKNSVVPSVEDPFLSPPLEVPEDLPPQMNTSTPPQEENNNPVPEIEAEEEAVNEVVKIVINEFISNPPEEEKEWIELYNPSTSTVDLQDWHLADSLGNIFSPTSTIGPLGFVVLELQSQKLNNDGDTIILKSGDSIIIDQVVYGDWGTTKENNTPQAERGHTLARFPDGQDRGNDLEDWEETTTPTKGEANKITAPVPPLPPSPPNPSPVVGSRSDLPSAIPPVPPSCEGVVINEVYPNPVGSDTQGEFIELFNSTSRAIDLSACKLVDSSQVSYSLNQTIRSFSYLSLPRLLTKIFLNNTTHEEINLVDKSGRVISSVGYEEAKNENESLARNEDGVFEWTGSPTSGRKNIIVKIAFPQGQDVEDHATTTRPTVSSTTHQFLSPARVPLPTSTLILSEVLLAPNRGEEFIELFNTSSTTIDISGFILDDSEGGSKSFSIPEHTTLWPQAYAVFYKSQTKLSLNNSEESVRLFSPRGLLEEEISIEESEKGQSYGKDEDGEWQWTTKITPGEANTLAPEDPSTVARAVPAKVQTKKSKKFYSAVSLEKIREQELGDLVIVEGAVTVLPGTFGSQYFYVGDSSANASFGIQVYMNKKDFPSLIVGDRVQIRGELSQAFGETRIKIKEKSDIAKLNSHQSLLPQTIDVLQVDEPAEGSLVTVNGEVTETKSSYLYLDDGTDEVKVYLKAGAGIQGRVAGVGDVVEVTGIVSQSRSGYQLLPRAKEDIKKVATSTPLLGVDATTKTKSTFLVATVGGLTSFVVGLIVKAHGFFAWQYVRKGGKIFLSFILQKKNKV